MASKYDLYWQNKVDVLRKLLMEANQMGESTPVDVSDIQVHGERRSWHGIVEVSQEGLKKGEMAHAKSLGKIVLKNRLLDFFNASSFELTVSSNFKLSARCLSKKTEQFPGSVKMTRENRSLNGNNQDKTGSINEKRLQEILAKIPWEAWDKINREEPEWKVMQPFLQEYGYGRFAVLMIVTGLNDYQLKGRAEKAYWPPIGKILDPLPPPSSPSELATFLEPFYQNERLSKDKVRRLNRFLSSPLAGMLWNLSPEKTSTIFPYIWRELAKTMWQDPQDKTISFAMKCLGLSLLMKGISSFNFSAIPIPVDIRIARFSKRAGLCSDESPEILRNIWNRILSYLQSHNTAITMIHLDSLIWQIANMDAGQILKYFERIGASEAGKEMCSFLQNRPVMNTNEQRRCGLSSQLAARKSSREKVICFIPCCGSKRATGKIILPEHYLNREEIPNTWNDLFQGRTGVEYCLDKNSSKTSALYLYTGSPYEVLDKEGIINLLNEKHFRLLIISAGYGLLDAFEPALDYDEQLQGKAASHWREKNLSGIIAELLIKENPSRVYGFFAGTTTWSKPGSKYRYFYTEGVKEALRNGLKAEAGCFYRMEGFGVKAILGGLGRTFSEFMKSGFEDNYVQSIYKDGRQDGNVKIGFDKITP